MISELIQNSRFVLVFTGECPYVAVFDGWNALLAEIHFQYTVDDDEHAELIGRLEDADAWTIDTCHEKRLPYCYSEDTGEIGIMTIYRLIGDFVVPVTPNAEYYRQHSRDESKPWHERFFSLENAYNHATNAYHAEKLASETAVQRLARIDEGVKVDADDLAKMRDGTKLTRAGLVEIIVYQNEEIESLRGRLNKIDEIGRSLIEASA